MKRGYILKTILIGVLAALVLLWGGWFYLTGIQQSLWEQSVNNMLEVTRQAGKSFEVFVEQGLSMLEGRANNFAQYSSQDAAAIGNKLDLYEEGDLAFTTIDLTHGIIYFNSNLSKNLTASEVDLYLSFPENGFLEPFIDEGTGQRVVGYFERFIFADGAKGMVRKTVTVSDIEEEFSLSFYDDSGFSYIVNADGDIVLRPGSRFGNRSYLNVFDVVELDGNTAEAANSFRSALSDGNSGVMRLNFSGEEQIFAFVPIDSTDGWYMVSIVPNNTVMEYGDSILKSSQVFVAVLAVVLIIFASFVFLTIRHRRQINAQEIEVLYREHLFNLLAVNTNDVYVMLASDGRQVKYVSPNIERVTGVSTEVVTADLNAFKKAIHAGNDSYDENLLFTVPIDGQVSCEGNYIHRVTGARVWFNETIYHTVMSGDERYIIVLADRTEDRKRENVLSEALDVAEAANRAKSSFLSNMSHDIRTPMNAIVGLATLLQRDANDPEKVREHTRKITASSQHLLGLINDVLDMSKIESGKTTLNIGEFNLAELVDELNTIIRPQAKAKKQSFDVMVNNLVNENLFGDKLRISQVMINILSNAVKYTPVGGNITMNVRQLGQSSPGIAAIRFTVADNGIGMSEEFQQQVFEPFTRETSSAVNQIQGTGLGMAISKSLVDLMGGTISVKSKLDKGSTFVLDLNLRISEQEDDLNFWTDHGIENTLVVDDEADVCTSILSAMAGTGVSVQFALDGPTAVSMAEAAHKNGRELDLILLDWKMPGMDGLETAKQIRKKIPSHIPIMILTAYDWEEIREEGIAAGIDGFLSKPFFLSNFKEVVRNMHRADAKTAPSLPKADLNGRRFLCAEDNELNMEILSELLDMEGATCEVATDGQEAVEKFSAAPAGTYDAILMDVQMPIMNGYEATRAIRALERPDAGTIPIVAMTANAFADDIRDAMTAGMNAHVAKPVDMANLVEQLNRLWRREQEQ